MLPTRPTPNSKHYILQRRIYEGQDLTSETPRDRIVESSAAFSGEGLDILSGRRRTVSFLLDEENLARAFSSATPSSPQPKTRILVAMFRSKDLVLNFE
jgi:hypothetical protein